MADIVPAWMWRDPGEIIEGLLTLSARRPGQGLRQGETPVKVGPKDRYYTMARRCAVRGAVKRAMRGER